MEDNRDDKDNIEGSVFIGSGSWVRNKKMSSVLHFIENKPIPTHNEQIEEHGFTPVFHHGNNESCDDNKQPIFGIETTWVVSAPNISLEYSNNSSDNISNDKENCCSLPET